MQIEKRHQKHIFFTIVRGAKSPTQISNGTKTINAYITQIKDDWKGKKEGERTKQRKKERKKQRNKKKNKERKKKKQKKKQRKKQRNKETKKEKE